MSTPGVNVSSMKAAPHPSPGMRRGVRSVTTRSRASSGMYTSGRATRPATPRPALPATQVMPLRTK